MNSSVNFLLESAISLSLLALIYVLLLRKETFFKLNRLFLLGSVLFSIILPFLKFRIYDPNPVVYTEITVTPYRNLIEAVTIYSHGFSGSIEQAVLSTQLIILVYFAGVVFFLGVFLFRVIQLSFIIKKNPVQMLDGFKLVIVEKETSPYSFLQYVFVNRSLQKNPDYQKMIVHELEHVKQGHSFDVIILEILTVFQWFNPFMWMLRRAIRENHEYLADRAVLNSGINRGYYKKLLLQQFTGEQLVIANNFNYSLIKKRIKMMSKIKSSKLANTKIILGILAAFALVVAFACEQKESVQQPDSASEKEITVKSVILNDGRIKLEGTAEDLEKYKSLFSDIPGFEIVTDSLGNNYLLKREVVEPKSLDSDEQVFFVVEEMPEFPGGELALRKYIANTIKYPEVAQTNGIQGKVYVTFVVSKDGVVANAKIARGVDPSLDREALRVVNTLPKWKAGKQRGETVNVSYTVPINFVLQ